MARHVDSGRARERLRALPPRWVPSAAELDTMSGRRQTGDDQVSQAHGADPGRHALPDAPTRWQLDAAGVRGLVSLALAALAGALVVVLVGWPRGTEAPPTAVLPADSDVLRDPAASRAESVVVDVDGAVRRPGVVELTAGDRVVDALDAAGGVLPRGDTGALNLAEVLLDGQQVVVPRRGAVLGGGSTGSTAPAPDGGLVNLNTATETELDTLPGIGPVLAAAIVEWREQNGGFASIEQLQEVSGIGPATYADLAPLVRV